MGDMAQDESESSRARAAAKALSGVLLKAANKGANHGVMVTLVADEIGVSWRIAAKQVEARKLLNLAFQSTQKP